MAPLLILFLSFLLFFFSLSTSLSPINDTTTKLIYKEWLIKHHKKHYNELFENEKRYEIFKDNLRCINEHNAGNHSYRLGPTVFSHLTTEEYHASYLGYQPPVVAEEKVSFKHSDMYPLNQNDQELPDSIDWRDNGAVTPVKDQSTCNSCWAFSAIAAVESINKIITGNLISLSEQEIIDCYKKDCNPWYKESAFQFIIDNGGINKNEDYPYRAKYVGCDENKRANNFVSIDGYNKITPNNEAYMKLVVTSQPISVGIDAYDTDFKLYTSGIFTGACGTNLDHAVTIIGYGSENGMDYWLLKNSWGEQWGEGGFMKIQRNTNIDEGKCGIAMDPSYPMKSQ